MNVKCFYGIAIMLICMLPISISAQKPITQYDPEASYDEGVLLFQNKNYGAAISAFDRYMSSVDDAKLQKAVDAQYYAAVSALYLGNGDGESKVLEFVNQNPGSTWAVHANYLYANSLFKKKKYRDALAIYEKTEAASLSAEEAQKMQFNMAYAYFQTDCIQKALPIFKGTMLNKGEYQDAAKYYYAHIQYVQGKNLEALNYFNQLRNKPTYSKVVPAYIMQINYKEGDVDAILEEGDYAVQHADRKRKSELAFIVADAWYQKKNYAKAMEYFDIYRSNLQGKEIAKEAFFQMGVCEARTGDCESGIKDLQKIAGEKDQLGQYASYLLAQCYTNVGEQKYARNAFYTAYVNNFNPVISEDALFNYAKLSLMPGVDPFNEAITQLDAFIAANPYSAKKAQAEELGIYLLLNAKDYDGALSRLENMSTRSAELQDIYSQLLYSTAVDAFQKSDYAKAQAYFSQILNSNVGADRKAEACYWLGESAYALGDLNLAEKYYKQFNTMDGSAQLPIQNLADYNLGYIDYQKTDYDVAIADFKRFIQNSDDRKSDLKSDAYIRLGDCYFMDRSYSSAINYYDLATRLNQNNADYAIYQQGLCYSAMGQNNKKIEMLNNMIKTYPSTNYYEKALFEIGNTYLISGDKRSALASFERLVKQRPRSSYARQALMKIGMVYYNNNQNDQALENLQKLVENYQGTDEAREAISIIRSIYMEKNQLNQFFAYVEKKGIAHIAVSEQDSLAFANAENFYLDSRYASANEALRYYFTNYSNGAFLLKAHQYALVCAEKVGTEQEMLTHLNYILSQPDNDYTDDALLKMARIEYDHASYDKAGSYYERLSQITEEPLTRLEALEGSMKSNFFMGNYDKAIQLGQTLSESSQLSSDQVNQINHILGKSYFEKRDYTSAIEKLDKSSKNDKTVYGAESAYYSAVSSLRLKKYDEAENKMFAISDNFSSYSYWVAKSFIVLADVYVAKENYFQAKETLRSIIDNYKGNDLKAEAQSRLKEIEGLETKAKSYQPAQIEPMEEEGL